MQTPSIVHIKAPRLFNPQAHVAGCLILANNRFLLLKRHPRKPQGTTWGIPSGKQEKKETPLEAVVREVEEEVGLALAEHLLKNLGTLFVEHPDLHFCYHLFFAKYEKKPEIVLNPLEHTESCWVTLEEAMDLPLIGGGAETLRYCFAKL